MSNTTANSTGNLTHTAAQDKIEATKSKQVVSSLGFNAAIFAALVVLFLVQRIKLTRIYQPKSSSKLVNDEKRPEPLPKGPWRWLPELLRKSDNFIIQQGGLDGYFFVRYLYIIASYALFSAIWMLPILLPINVQVANEKVPKPTDILDKLIFSKNETGRKYYYAHVFVGWFFFGGFLFVIYREMTYFTSLRQAILSSPRYAKKLSSRTVLFQCVPEQYLSETEFSKLFIGVKRIWITRAARELASLVQKRYTFAENLEVALTGYIKKGMKAALKLKKKHGIEVGNDIREYVPAKHRPKHRRGLLGKKVDSIEYYKEKLVNLNKEIKVLQDDHMNASPFKSVFVEFENQYYAQVAKMMVPHHLALTMSPVYDGIEPKDIIWFNMSLRWYQKIIGSILAVGLVAGLIALWTPIVAFAGAFNSIQGLVETFPWLTFLTKLDDWVISAVTALLPTILLAVLMMLVPMFLRRVAMFTGAPSEQHLEHFIQQAFFAFQVMQVFLVITISSTAVAVVATLITSPQEGLNILATKIPMGSNFYLSYIALRCFSFSSGKLVQLVPLILFYLLGSLLDNTARKKWSRYVNLDYLLWGSEFPVYTNLVTIVMAYAVISPLILLFTAVGFFLLYVAYLSCVTYVYQETPDSRGLHYPRALFHSLTGVYIGELSLLGMLLASERRTSGPVILQFICIAFTIVVHFYLLKAFSPLLNNIPVDIMKPLDGHSETPSYKPTALDAIKPTYKELPSFPVRKYQPRNSTGLEIKAATSSILSENTYEISNPMNLNNENALTTVPLLADGDTAPLPPAPIWKKFFMPHIYSSYKAVKSKVPDIYKLPDPNELIHEEDIKNAYHYPAVSAKCPIIWVPKDPFGFSTAEIEKLGPELEGSDRGAHFDEDLKIQWTSRPPDHPFEKVNLGPRYTNDTRT